MPDITMITSWETAHAANFMQQCKGLISRQKAHSIIMRKS